MEHELRMAELLRPLGVYDLEEGAVNRGELGAYGLGLDVGLEQLDAAAREMCLATAEDVGLELVEALLPYRPACDTVEERRLALAALLRIGGDSFTTAAVNDTLTGCGINARAVEGEDPGYVTVVFPNARGIPAAFGELRAIIEEILPCHLEVTYRFWYNSWDQLAAQVSTWGGAVETGRSWYELSTWAF